MVLLGLGCAGLVVGLPDHLVPVASRTLVREVVTVSGVILGWLAARHSRRLLLPTMKSRLLWISFLIVVTAGMLGVESDVRGVAMARFYILYGFLFLLGRALVSSREELRWMAVPIAAYALAQALLGIVQFVLGYVGPWRYVAEEFVRTDRFGLSGGVGTLGARPPLGLFLVIGLTITAWRFMERGGTSLSWPWAVSAFVISVGLLVSLSRTSWIGGFAALVACLSAMRRGSIKKLALLVGVAAVTVLSVSAFVSQGRDVAGSRYWSVEAGLERSIQGITLSDRTQLWVQEVWPAVQKPAALLFGRGPGAVGGTVGGTSAQGLVPNTDNLYLHVLVEFGLVGLVALLVGFGALFSRLRRGHAQVRPLGLGLLVGFSVASFPVDTLTFVPATPTVAFLLGACISAVSLPKRG